MPKDAFNAEHTKIAGIVRANEGEITLGTLIMPITKLQIQYVQKVTRVPVGGSYQILNVSQPFGQIVIGSILSPDARYLVQKYGQQRNVVSTDPLAFTLDGGVYLAGDMEDATSGMEIATGAVINAYNVLVNEDSFSIEPGGQHSMVTNNLQLSAESIDEPSLTSEMSPSPTPIPTPTQLPTPTPTPTPTV